MIWNYSNAQLNGRKSVITAFTPKAIQIRSSEGFVHPGIGLSVNDLERIQKMVRMGNEPWAIAFDHFRSNPKASKNYVIQNLDKNGNPKYEEMADGNGQYEARRDADASFAQVIMWYITGDKDYSNKALQIIRSWYTSTKRKTGDMLTAGMAMQKFCFAAEVLRYTPHSSWTESDTKGFTGFLNIMLPSTDRPTAFMNQGSIATMGYMSIAIFMNDKELYAKAITRATVGVESQAPNRDYSLKNQIREVTDPVTGKQDMVLVEMGRDQGHSQGDIGALGSLAQTAFIQGTKVNSNGEIVENEHGVNLFRFMNNRLLTGAGIVAKYNLGYDIDYPPTSVGVNSKSETYYKVSGDGRGSLAAVYELIYNHYRYNENVSEKDTALKYIQQVQELKKIETSSQDFFGDGTLLFSHEKAIQNPGKSKGKPKQLKSVDYLTISKTLGRIQASTYTGTKGDKTGNIGIEDYTDMEGTRSIISGIKINFYAWYKNVDFGQVPVNKMLIRAGSASSRGCKIDVILLDNVAGINFNNVTEADLQAGEKIGTIQTTATGWWTNFIVSTGLLERKLSGKHSFALRFYGSDNVYHFQANVDWFKFVNTFTNEKDLLPKQEILPVKADQISIVYKGDATLKKEYATLHAIPEGTTIVFPFVEFRNGPHTILFRVRSNGIATLSLVNVNKTSHISDEPFVKANIIDTKGKWTDIRVDITAMDKKITGGQMLYLTIKGNGALVYFEEMQLDPLVGKR
jgi:hypothetical protein